MEGRRLGVGGSLPIGAAVALPYKGAEKNRGSYLDRDRKLQTEAHPTRRIAASIVRNMLCETVIWPASP